MKRRVVDGNNRATRIHQGSVLRPAIVLAIALATGLAQAQTVEWVGGTGFWRDDANWAQGSPSEDSSVRISSGQATLNPLDDRQVGTLTLGAAGALLLHAELKVSGDFVSQGRLVMGGQRFASPNLIVSGNSLLSGAGTTVLSPTTGVRRSILKTQNLTIEAGHTLTGASGQINASSIFNQGVIEASGLVFLEAPSEGSVTDVVNTGVMRVVNGGRLTFSAAMNVDNSAGRIDIVDGMLSGAGAVINGTVKGHGANSKLESMIQSATLQGTLQSTSLVVSGTVVNDGLLTLELSSGYFGPRLVGVQGAVIEGQGRIEVASGTVAELTNITLGSGQTFVGAVLASGTVANRGIINVRGSWTIEASEGNRLVNEGSINVGPNSALILNNGRLDNVGGMLTFEGASGIAAGNRETGWVSGGILKTTAQTWLAGDLGLQDVVLPGDLAVGAGQLGLRGLIQVSSTLSVGKDAQKGGAFRLYGETVLTGAGTTILARGRDGSASTIESHLWSSGALTVDASHVLKGEGTINVRVLNKGLVVADTGDGLRFGTTVTNTGTIRSQGGNLSFSSGVLNKGGLIDIADGGALLGAGVIEGGVLVARGNGARVVANELRDLTLKGNWTAGSTWQAYGPSIGMSGTITNEGVIRVGGVTSSGEQIGGLVVRGAGILTGTGRTEIGGDGTQPPGLSGEGIERSTLTNAADHTLVGRGRVSNLNILNQGLVNVRDGALSFIGAALRNEGHLHIAQGAALQMPEAFVQDGQASRTIVSGRLETPRLDLIGGELSGGGVIHGALNVTGGTVHAGGDAGALSLEGDFTAGDDSTLVVTLTDTVAPGQARLFVSGNAALAGLLILEFGTDAKLGDTFDILYGSTQVSGAFSRVDVIGTELQASVSYFNDHVSVSLVSSVPEPGTSMLAMIGAAFVAVAARRSRHRFIRA